LAEIKEMGLDLEFSSESEESSHCDSSVGELSKNSVNSLKKKKRCKSRSNSCIIKKSATVENSMITATEKEDRVIGKVSYDTFIQYAKHGNYFRCFLVIVLLIAAQAMFVLSDWWLKYWSSLDKSEQQEDFMAWGFALLVLITAILGFIRCLLFFNFSLSSSTSIHKAMYSSVMNSPMSFFNSNPQGRILNRFSKDQGNVDEQLPTVGITAIELALFVISAVILVCISIPFVMIILFPMGIFFAIARRKYLYSSREIKRLDGITISPVYAEFGATLDGITTIRAFGVEEENHQYFLSLLGKNAKAWYSFILVSRWLGFRLDLESTVFLTTTVLLAVGLKGSIDADLMALALVYTLSLNGQFQWAVRQSAEFETYMTAFERLVHYSRLTAEKDDGVKAPTDWPKTGKVDFENLSVRYREDLPLVLKNISFSVPTGTKLGIVARTGAGKSSLVMALLRLNQIVSGDIKLDGVSLTKLKLEDSRKHISWIPQDPSMFSGSLRFNLDPFEKFSDKEIWEALGSVQLAPLVQSHPMGLSMDVSEGGLSLSVGQRQLVSLARASLLRNPILALDESTANVDHETDQLIQHALRNSEAFRGCTVFTIAHRINTVIDSDMILVLSEGKVIEFDKTLKLVEEPNSWFSKMIDESNDPIGLRKLARESEAYKSGIDIS